MLTINTLGLVDHNLTGNYNNTQKYKKRLQLLQSFFIFILV